MDASWPVNSPAASQAARSSTASPIAIPGRGSRIARSEHADRQILNRKVGTRCVGGRHPASKLWIVRLVERHHTRRRVIADRATIGSSRRPRSRIACPAHVQRMERVEHHRELVGARGADRRLGAAGMRAVRHAVGVQRHRSVLDALPAHELRACVVDHLVRHHVRVVVRHGHRVRIEVERPRAERADDEVVALERLVHRRRQVDAADARLEIVDAERPRVVVAVPSHEIERDATRPRSRTAGSPSSRRA